MNINRLTLFKLLFLLVIATLYSCDENRNEYEVKYYGALKNLMNGSLEAVVSLDSIPSTGLYALGAIEQLQGEILIWNGVSYNGKALDKDRVKILPKSDSIKASLLVYSHVDQWHDPIVLSSFKNITELQDLVLEQAQKMHIDTNLAFPFLLNGKIKNMDWHVINWPQGDSIHNHHKHRQSGAYGSLQDQEVAILGFYSKRHKGIFTHHSSNIHMHFKKENTPKLAGHIDALSSKELQLYIPKS